MPTMSTTGATAVRVAASRAVTPTAPLSLLDGVPIRRPAATPTTPLYSIRLGAAVKFRPAERGWHADCPACGQVNALDDLDLQTALDTIPAVTGPDITTEPAVFLAAWQAAVWRRVRGGRRATVAAVLAGMADSDGRVTLDTAAVRTLAMRCNARTPALAILVRGLISAGLLHGGEPVPRVDWWGISTLQFPAAATPTDTPSTCTGIGGSQLVLAAAAR
jgi:hypothetical protein